jgi:hypothetical protein
VPLSQLARSASSAIGGPEGTNLPVFSFWSNNRFESIPPPFPAVATKQTSLARSLGETLLPLDPAGVCLIGDALPFEPWPISSGASPRFFKA